MKDRSMHWIQVLSTLIAMLLALPRLRMKKISSPKQITVRRDLVSTQQKSIVEFWTKPIGIYLGHGR